MEFNAILKDNKSKVQEIIEYKNKPISVFKQPAIALGAGVGFVLMGRTICSSNIFININVWWLPYRICREYINEVK